MEQAEKATMVLVACVPALALFFLLCFALLKTSARAAEYKVHKAEDDLNAYNKR